MDNRELFHGPRRYPESYSGRIPQKMCGARHTTSADHQGCNRQIPETKMKTPARWSTCRKTAHRGPATDTGVSAALVSYHKAGENTRRNHNENL